MTIGLQLCRWYYQEIGAWKWVSADFVFCSSIFSLFLTYSLSKTLKKWMTLNKVLLVRVIHMTKQFWDKIGRFDADKYAGNVLKLECYKLVHAVLMRHSRRFQIPLMFLLFVNWPFLVRASLPTTFAPSRGPNFWTSIRTGSCGVGRGRSWRAIETTIKSS